MGEGGEMGCANWNCSVSEMYEGKRVVEGWRLVKHGNVIIIAGKEI